MSSINLDHSNTVNSLNDIGKRYDRWRHYNHIKVNAYLTTS